MHVVMAQYQDENTGQMLSKPRFYVLREDGDLDAERADALALSTRLNRAASLTYMTTQYPTARRGTDHQFWIDAGLAALHALDEHATVDTLYSVEGAEPYTGPNESVTAELTAMMVAFQSSSSPPNSVYEAMFRLIRDGAPPPSP